MNNDIGIIKKNSTCEKQENYLSGWGTARPEPIGLKECVQTAVCIPLVRDQNTGEPEILFEVRSSGMADQPGDICFPGGHIECGETPEEAVIREISEELLIPQERIILIGREDYLFTGNLVIYPFIAALETVPEKWNEEETEELFTVPLSFFMQTEPENYPVKLKKIPPDDFPYDRIAGGEKYPFHARTEPEYFYTWKERTIWGFTARILRNAIERRKRQEILLTEDRKAESDG